MDIQNIIIALQDQLLKLEEQLEESKKQSALRQALCDEQVRALNHRISELESSKRTLPFPGIPEPSYPGLGFPATATKPWSYEGITATTGITYTIDKTSGAVREGDLMMMSINGQDAVMRLA